MSSFILALDMDWQGTKATVFTSDLKQTGMAFEESSLLCPEPGQAVQEPDDIIGSAQRVIRRAIEESGVQAADISVVGLAGELGGFLGVDKAGKAMTPYVTAQDTRCSKYVDLMRAKDGPEIIKLSGGPAGTQGAQILWWKHEDEHTYFDIAKFVTAYAYIGMQMCGLDAEGAFYDYTGFVDSGFGDAVYKTWSPDILHKFHLSEDKLPKVVAPTDVIGTVCDAFAKESGLAAGTKVVAGCVTAAAGLLGAGITKEGCIGQFTGSLSLVAGVVKDHNPDALSGDISAMRCPVGDSWYAMAFTSGSGLAERWFKDNLTGKVEAGYAELDAEAAGVAPGADGVFFVPKFCARDAAKGSFVGLDWHVTRAYLYRAMLEGIAYQKRLVLDSMRSAYGSLDFSAVAAVDAAERGDLSNQIEADVLGMTVQPLQADNPVGLGCAAVAAQGGGLTADAASLIPEPAAGSAKKPDAAAQAAYEPCVRAYRDLTVLLSGFNPAR
ncbi:MAG: hypothetical protein HDQ87_08090 [Clostridia bacterium]|nr:hypothetical protein [Clostridia bacterium]